MKVLLKPCPFCGNPATVREALQKERPEWSGSYGEWWIVECSNEYCLMHPKISFPDKHGAVAVWNTRRNANLLTYNRDEQFIDVEDEGHGKSNN